MAKKITKKAMALIMSAMILITATPVFAASTGSVASDPNTGVAEGSVSIEVESSDGQYYDFYIIYVNE